MVAGDTTLAVGADWFSQYKMLGNEPWRWLTLLGVLLASLIVGKVISFLLERQADRLRDRVDVLGMLFRSLSRPATMLALAAGLHFARPFMNLEFRGKSYTDMWEKVCGTIAVLAVGWFIYRLVDILEYYLRRLTSKTETLLDDQLVPLLRKSLRVLVVIVAVLFIAQNVLDWDIGALIAGLGIGGLALALAAKDMLANLFGSVAIFADRPFHMGDRVVIGGRDGFVEEVGFRSTRIRTLAGHVVTVPNSVVANEAVENISRRPYIKRVLDVTVTYDTPPEKLRRGVQILQQMLEARKDHFHPDQPGRVYFSEFNAASLNIVVYYWFTPPDWWEYLAFTNEFNMELLERFNEEGIEFAFPTQTLYVKQDSPIEADVCLTPAGDGPSA